MRQRNVLLIVNPLSSRARESLAPADRLRARGFCVVERELRDPGAISDSVRHESADADLIVLGGGDGTLNAAAAAIKERGLPVGILPLGTANDLARTLGIPQRLDESCDIIADGHTSRIDLGCVNGRLFFNVASMGVSARVGELMTKGAKRRWGAPDTGQGFARHAALLSSNCLRRRRAFNERNPGHRWQRPPLRRRHDGR